MILFSATFITKLLWFRSSVLFTKVWSIKN